MIIRFLRLTCFVCILTALPMGTGFAVDIICPSESLPATTPWNLVELSAAPTYEWADQNSPVWSLYYAGENYKGKPTQVFAYYASPATMDSNYPQGSTFPAVVLIHGGGGTAFAEWVELWAKRGYAAIAMDLAGRSPDGGRLANGGPDQTDDVKFGDIDQPVENQWPYHSVANVILAHSLIQSFDEVDANRTAVTGISWGGYLTCIVAGLDSRFKAAVPVYGCGFLHKNSYWLNRFSAMTPQQKNKWIQLWDPSVYIGSAVMPVFFINGTNDFAYPLDSYSKTYELVKSECNFRITVNMHHNHKQGWAPKEIELFVNQYLTDGVALPTIMTPKLTGGKICAEVKSETTLTSANIHYTTGTVPINKLDWKTLPVSIERNQIISPVLPDDVTICFFSVSDNREAIVSSKLVYR